MSRAGAERESAQSAAGRATAPARLVRAPLRRRSATAAVRRPLLRWGWRLPLARLLLLLRWRLAAVVSPAVDVGGCSAAVRRLRGRLRLGLGFGLASSRGAGLNSSGAAAACFASQARPAARSASRCRRRLIALDQVRRNALRDARHAFRETPACARPAASSWCRTDRRRTSRSDRAHHRHWHSRRAAARATKSRGRRCARRFIARPLSCRCRLRRARSASRCARESPAASRRR